MSYINSGKWGQCKAVILKIKLLIFGVFQHVPRGSVVTNPGQVSRPALQGWINRVTFSTIATTPPAPMLV